MYYVNLAEASRLQFQFEHFYILSACRRIKAKRLARITLFCMCTPYTFVERCTLEFFCLKIMADCMS